MERLINGLGVKWWEHLGLAAMTCCLMPHKTTGHSPFNMLFDREATTSTEVGQTSYIPNVSYKHAVQLHSQKMDIIFQ